MGVVKRINIKNRTYYSYTDIISLKNFKSKLLKIDKKSYKDIIFTTLDILQLRKLIIVKIFTLCILYIYLLIMQTDILRKKT